MTLSRNEIADLFDARASRYVHDDWHRRYAEQLVARVPLRPGDIALDAGTGGTIAFSTMRAGSPSAGRVFRECAAKCGVMLQDPSEALGSENRCRAALADAGFEVMAITPDRLEVLRRQYLEALRQSLETDLHAVSAADVLCAVGRRTRL
jgi:hypothetical protein